MIKEKFGISDRIIMGMAKVFGSSLYLSRGARENVLVELYDGVGRLKDKRLIHNTLTTAGKYGAADQILASPTLPKAGWMEVGTGTGGTTKLNLYIAGSRTALDSKTRDLAVVTMICTFVPGVGTGAITEAGVFDVVTQDTINMWLYASFAVINKVAADSLVITWTLTYS
jgi:hypothetical protein